jgi:endonuclease/exonuclease/phosphatase (EEP) superfamily protein YafD
MVALDEGVFMHRLLLLSLAVFACHPPTKKITTPPATASSIRVATFNAHRFFDTNCDSGRCGGTEYEELPTQEEFVAKAAQLAAALSTLRADVIILQEIESEACLVEINKSLRFPVFVEGETQGSASLDVAILAKGSLQETRTHRQTPLILPDGTSTKFARELLELHLLIEDTDVIIVGAHFRSKVKDDAARRLAEAKATSEVLNQLAAEKPDALIVFGGDLNDTPDSETLNALDGFTRVAKELGEKAATFVYKGEPQAIDHLFVVRGSYLEGSAKVIWNPAVSDHGALIAEFLLGR